MAAKYRQIVQSRFAINDNSAIHVIVIVKAKYLVKSHLELQENGRIGTFMSPVSLVFHTIGT